MSWHWSVGEGSPVPWVAALFRPAITPVRESMKIRGRDTILASCGAARGTFMTSMRNRAVLGSVSGGPPEQPLSILPALAHACAPARRGQSYPAKAPKSFPRDRPCDTLAAHSAKRGYGASVASPGLIAFD